MKTNEEIEVRFGKRVRLLRHRAQLSQEALGEKALLHRNYISDLERGKRNVSLRNIERIAKALKVEIADLFSCA